MKKMVEHFRTCPDRTSKKCATCRKMSFIVDAHARTCNGHGCLVPHCGEMRARYEKIRLQQQAMDDRRRAGMNDHYAT